MPWAFLCARWAPGRVVHGNRLQIFDPHLTHFDVQRALFKRRPKPAFKPAGSVHDEIASGSDGSPKHPQGFINRLCIGGGRTSESAPPLLEYANLNPEWVNWQKWLKQVMRSELRGWPVRQCNSYLVSIAMARRGQGVAFVQLPILQQELSDNALVRIESRSLKTVKTHHLCYRKGTPLPLNAQRLFAFLVE